jgi:fructokinase
MKVFCVGEALIDMIATEKGRPLSQCQHFLKKAGGAPANVAAAIAALGGDVSLAAKVGADPFGKHLIDLLNEMGVSTTWIVTDPNFFTTLAFVSLMEDGDRDFYFNRGADGKLSRQDIASLNLKDYSICHFGSATAFLPGPLQNTYSQLLQEAINENKIVSFDPNYRQLLFQENTDSFIAQCMPFIQYSHFIKLSEQEAMLITDTNNVQEAISILQNKTSAIIAITLGKEGAIVCTGTSIQQIKSSPIDCVDATGAGDAFVGAVLYQISKYNLSEFLHLQNSDWEKIIANANKAGAKTCTYLGAMEAFKQLNNSIFD